MTRPADGVAGADLTGRGAFGGEQRLVGAAGIVPLGVGHRGVDEQVDAALRGGNGRQRQTAGMGESGAGVAEQVSG